MRCLQIPRIHRYVSAKDKPPSPHSRCQTVAFNLVAFPLFFWGDEEEEKEEISRLLTCRSDVEHDTTTKPTGQFNYTFSVPKDVKVLPHTYQEYMMYIDARRRVKLGDIQSREERTGSTQEQRQLAEDMNLTE